MVLRQFFLPLDRLLRVRTPVVIEGHLRSQRCPVHRGALGEHELRSHDLLHRGSRRPPLRRRPRRAAFRTESGVCRTLMLSSSAVDVVLRVAVDRLPLHILRGGFDPFAMIASTCRAASNFVLLNVTPAAPHSGGSPQTLETSQSLHPVRRGIVELGRVDEATVHRRHNFAAWQSSDRCPHT